MCVLCCAIMRERRTLLWSHTSSITRWSNRPAACGVTTVLLGCYKSVTGVLQGCYKGVIRALHGCDGTTKAAFHSMAMVLRCLSSAKSDTQSSEKLITHLGSSNSVTKVEQQSMTEEENHTEGRACSITHCSAWSRGSGSTPGQYCPPASAGREGGSCSMGQGCHKSVTRV
jgi:hypothetical protein